MQGEDVCDPKIAKDVVRDVKDCMPLIAEKLDEFWSHSIILWFSSAEKGRQYVSQDNRQKRKTDSIPIPNLDTQSGPEQKRKGYV